MVSDVLRTYLLFLPYRGPSAKTTRLGSYVTQESQSS